MTSRRIKVEVKTKESELSYSEDEWGEQLTILEGDAMFSSYIKLSNDHAKQLLHNAIDNYFDSRKDRETKLEIDPCFL